MYLIAVRDKSQTEEIHVKNFYMTSCSFGEDSSGVKQGCFVWHGTCWALGDKYEDIHLFFYYRNINNKLYNTALPENTKPLSSGIMAPCWSWILPYGSWHAPMSPCAAGLKKTTVLGYDHKKDEWLQTLSFVGFFKHRQIHGNVQTKYFHFCSLKSRFQKLYFKLVNCSCYVLALLGYSICSWGTDWPLPLAL